MFAIPTDFSRTLPKFETPLETNCSQGVRCIKAPLCRVCLKIVENWFLQRMKMGFLFISFNDVTVDNKNHGVFI